MSQSFVYFKMAQGSFVSTLNFPSANVLSIRTLPGSSVYSEVTLADGREIKVMYSAGTNVQNNSAALTGFVSLKVENQSYLYDLYVQASQIQSVDDVPGRWVRSKITLMNGKTFVVTNSVRDIREKVEESS